MLLEPKGAEGSGTKESEARGCSGGIVILAGRIGRGRLPVVGSIIKMRQRTPSGRLWTTTGTPWWTVSFPSVFTSWGNRRCG